MNCGEEREMAGHGLCFKCYRAKERKEQRKENAVFRENLGNGDLLKGQKKLFKFCNRVLSDLADLPCVEEEWKDRLRILIKPKHDELARAFKQNPRGKAKLCER
jgi:hypothetical protein